jgi:hypothetical protein
LQGAELQGADLRGAQLQGARLQDAQLQGARLQDAQLQGAHLVAAQLQGADLQEAQLQGAHLVTAQLQGADLQEAQLQGADLWGAQLQGAHLRRAGISGANFDWADLTWSDLRGLSSAPLDEETYKELEEILTHAIRNERYRAARLQQMKEAVGQPAQRQTIRSPDQALLCDDPTLFRSCLTPEQIAPYARDRAAFLGKLGCQDAVIARGMATWHLRYDGQKDPLVQAFATHVTALPEKDCPGWAAVPAAQKDPLRKLAGGETSAP